PEYVFFADGRVWTREEKEKPPVEISKDDKDGEKDVKAVSEPEVKPLSNDYWRRWLTPRLPWEAPISLDDKEQKRLEKLHQANLKADKEGLTRGTNMYESVLGVLNKEHSSRVQGIIVFTDGRNNEGSASSYRELETKAKANKIPIFVVGVGEDRL